MKINNNNRDYKNSCQRVWPNFAVNSPIMRTAADRVRLFTVLVAEWRECYQKSPKTREPYNGQDYLLHKNEQLNWHLTSNRWCYIIAHFSTTIINCLPLLQADTIISRYPTICLISHRSVTITRLMYPVLAAGDFKMNSWLHITPGEWSQYLSFSTHTHTHTHTQYNNYETWNTFKSFQVYIF